MARRSNYSDPTANTAIKAVDKARRTAASMTPAKQRQGRRILVEFPDIFEGLTPPQIRALAMKAFQLAGNDVWAITRAHLEQAKAALR